MVKWGFENLVRATAARYLWMAGTIPRIKEGVER
jgi:hypothetical protein